MTDVFINYRTGDGDKTAALIEQALSQRFGSERIFRASKSIPPGAAFPQELIGNLRRSAVLLAVIGERWAESAKLKEEDDWVRREIVQALDWGITVLPVLEGRRTDRLRAADLPAQLTPLVEVQSLRLDLHNADADLQRIGDAIADLVPALKSADRAAPRPDEPGSTHNTAREVHGTIAQTRDLTGDVGTVIKDIQGPVHAGSGDINQTHFGGDQNNVAGDQNRFAGDQNRISGGQNRFSGDGTTYVAGDNRGGVRNRNRSGGSRRREDEDR